MPNNISYANTAPATSELDLEVVAQFMYVLMMRNFATSGWVFQGEGGSSQPGCIIASPSKPFTPYTDQDYVFHWVRDAAICAVESAFMQPLQASMDDDYVNFSELTQRNGIAASKTAGHACFKVNGDPREWSRQNDGPALRIISIIALWPRLEPSTQAIARRVIEIDLDYLLSEYRNSTVNLWEENTGMHLFTSAVQLRALRETKAQATNLGVKIPRPMDIDAAIDWLAARPQSHWVEPGGYYQSTQGGTGRGGNVNSDVLMAAVYGKLSCTTDPMLSTAAVVRDTFANPELYPINAWDQSQVPPLGPLIGRYPEDEYDGDMRLPNIGHPWAPCTSAFAEFYYDVAIQFAAESLVINTRNQRFFQQIGYNGASGVFAPASPTHRQILQLLGTAADRMLRGIIYHSDHLELSEQFDRVSGYEKSVRNLTWSYASFLSAVRARKEYSGVVLV